MAIIKLRNLVNNNYISIDMSKNHNLEEKLNLLGIKKDLNKVKFTKLFCDEDIKLLYNKIKRKNILIFQIYTVKFEIIKYNNDLNEIINHNNSIISIKKYSDELTQDNSQILEEATIIKNNKIDIFNSSYSNNDKSFSSKNNHLFSYKFDKIILKNRLSNNFKIEWKIFKNNNKFQSIDHCIYCQINLKNLNYYACCLCLYNVCSMCYKRFNNHKHKLNLIKTKNEIIYSKQVLLETEDLIEKFAEDFNINIILKYKDILKLSNLIKIFGIENYDTVSNIFIKSLNDSIFDIQTKIEEKIY